MRTTVYCKNCYSDLADAPGSKCPKCGRAFDRARSRTYLRRPFPSPGMIVAHVLATTALAVAAAFVVSFHQAARSSGH
jgi:hypothetical protein